MLPEEKNEKLSAEHVSASSIAPVVDEATDPDTEVA
jgi:hypothetical protein